LGAFEAEAPTAPSWPRGPPQAREFRLLEGAPPAGGGPPPPNASMPGPRGFGPKKNPKKGRGGHADLAEKIPRRPKGPGDPGGQGGGGDYRKRKFPPIALAGRKKKNAGQTKGKNRSGEKFTRRNTGER